jgi:hypothetical protein
MLYRTMAAAPDGLPQCGGGDAELGVRSNRASRADSVGDLSNPALPNAE